MRRHRDESIRRPEIDLAIARANSAASSAAAEQTTFVFRPGGAAFKNVYTSWAALVAAAAAVQGPRIVEFDDTFMACVIPAGVWNFGPIEDVTFFGVNAGTVATIADGATLIGFWRGLDLQIVYLGTATACIAAKPLSLYTFETCNVATFGGQPFIRNSSGFFIGIVMFELAQAGGFGSGVVFDNALGFIQLLAYGDSFIGAGALSGVTFFVNSASPSTSISLTQPGIVGGLVPGGNYFPESKPVNTIVIDSTVFDPRGNVFNTFAQAVGFAAQFQGPRTFEFRGAAPVIAPGAYNLGADPVRFQGDRWITTTLSIANGVTFAGTASIGFADIGINWFGAGATPLIDVIDIRTFIFDNVSLSNVGAGATAPFIRSSGAGIAVIDMLRASQIFPSGGGGAQFASTTLGAFTVINAYDASVIGINSLAQSGGGFVGVNQTDGANVNLPQAGIPGGLVVNTNLFLNGTTDRMNGPGGGSPALQAGTTTLVAGVSPAISAIITASSKIVGFERTDVGAAATTRYAALFVDRVIGTPGSFKITALNGAGVDAANGADVDWMIAN